ncbi:MAG TPA: hypothetical protein VFN97_28025 [Actinospica sp.]|nr:hypothetical protein [Actinospica sp.]
MKNPFSHRPHPASGGTLLLEERWHHAQQDVDLDCGRDPGSDLKADWELEGAAAEEILDSASDRRNRPPRV